MTRPLLPCLLILVCACSDHEPRRLSRTDVKQATIPTDRPKPQPKPEAKPAATTATPSAPAPAADLPKTTASAADSALGQPLPAKGGELAMTPPTGWKVEQPTSSMRRAQLRLPSATTGIDDGELVVFFFPGQGGSVDANIDRWAREWTVPGGDPLAALKRSTRTVNGLVVHHVDLVGEWSGGMNTKGGKRAGWRLLAAIVETANGPWFLKLVGPEATLAHWEPSWQAFVDGLKVAD
jgi:hypothetical protein